MFYWPFMYATNNFIVYGDRYVLAFIKNATRLQCYHVFAWLKSVTCIFPCNFILKLHPTNHASCAYRHRLSSVCFVRSLCLYMRLLDTLRFLGDWDTGHRTSLLPVHCGKAGVQCVTPLMSTHWSRSVRRCCRAETSMTSSVGGIIQWKFTENHLVCLSATLL